MLLAFFVNFYFFTTFKSTVSKSFIRPHIDCGDVIYDQPSSATFCSKSESVQCNAVLAITETFRGLSRERLYQELEPEHQHRRR